MKKVVLFIIMFIPLMVNADVQVNNEKLKEAFNEYKNTEQKFSPAFLESKDISFDIDFDFDNNKYYAINGDHKYEASYDFINNGVRVKYLYDVTKGLSYEEDSINSAKLYLGQVMYQLIEYINGIRYDNSYGLLASYLAIFGGELNISTGSAYIIYDDSDGSTVTCSENQKCIPRSKYGDYVVEVAKSNSDFYTSLNGKKSSDGTVMVNYSVKTDTDDKFEMDCMLTIYTDGGFEKLKASFDEQDNKNNEDNKDTGDNKDNNNNNNVDNKDTNTSDANESNKDEEVTENPKTGIIDNMLYLMVVMFIVYGLWIGIKNNNIFNKI